MATLAEMDRNFRHHEPTGPAQMARYMSIRAAARAFAEAVNMDVGDSREKSLALTKIEEAMMWANAGIARNG